VKAIDIKLLNSHIGEFEIMDFYMKQNLNDVHLPVGQRAYNLKKSIGKYGSTPRGKVFCKGLIEYWDNL